MLASVSNSLEYTAKVRNITNENLPDYNMPPWENMCESLAVQDAEG